MTIKMKGMLYVLAGVCIANTAKAQSTQDVAAIKKLCGCFSVSFDYAETFTNVTDKQYMAKPRTTKSITEYAFPIEESPTKFVIQHLLVIPDDKGTILKHWREDWEYEKNTWWEYSSSKEWTKVTVPPDEVKGQWLQSVWNVDDAPRYAGSSAWLRANKEEFWLNTTNAPLPRREFTKRSDYNLMKRTNKIIVSDQGYVHEQDNKKILRQENQLDSIVAEEKGYNTYVRLPDADCQKAASNWTSKKAEYWNEIRTAWENRMKNSEKIMINSKVDGSLLYEVLDELFDKNLSSADRKKAISSTLSKHLKIIK